MDYYIKKKDVVSLLHLVDADIENTMNRNRTMELIEKINEIIGG